MIEPARDPVAHRLCGNYLFRGQPPVFTRCDAIALLQLDIYTEGGYLKDYYAKASAAVVGGLRLAGSEAMRALLAGKVPSTLPHQLGMDEAMEVVSLGRLRRSALALYRQHDGYMFGGPFLTDASLQDRAYQPSLRQVAAWWTETREHTARGVKLIDQSLCAMAGWDMASEVPFTTLFQEFGYPDPAPVYATWADSF